MALPQDPLGVGAPTWGRSSRAPALLPSERLRCPVGLALATKGKSELKWALMQLHWL